MNSRSSWSLPTDKIAGTPSRPSSAASARASLAMSQWASGLAHLRAAVTSRTMRWSEFSQTRPKMSLFNNLEDTFIVMYGELPCARYGRFL